ncbi:hypothetical protein Tco_0475503 [Tanacetum coccineum]
MAAPVISISLDLSDESVGSSIPRVILFGSIPTMIPVVPEIPSEVLVAPEVAAVAVASPVGVLELDTHSSSESGPSEGSLPPVPVAPMVSPFLYLDDSKSDIELPERHVSSVTSVISPGGLLAGIHGLFSGRNCCLVRRITCGYPWPELEGKRFGMIQERFRSSAWCLRDRMSTPTQVLVMRDRMGMPTQYMICWFDWIELHVSLYVS